MAYASRDWGEIKMDKIEHGVEINSSLDAATGVERGRFERLMKEMIRLQGCFRMSFLR